MANGSVVVVGGTQGLGRELAQSYADEGREVIVTGRDQSRADTAANEIGGATRGIGFDLAEPHSIAGRLEGLGEVEHLVLAAIERDTNKVVEYDIDAISHESFSKADDPADMLIVATALHYGAPLVTNDHRIEASRLVQVIG